jgi:hypothetical protein
MPTLRSHPRIADLLVLPSSLFILASKARPQPFFKSRIISPRLRVFYEEAAGVKGVVDLFLLASAHSFSCS